MWLHCYKQLTCHVNIIANYLFIILQMTIEPRKEVSSLFEVTDFFTSGGDAKIQANMQEKKKEYGIFLQRRGLMAKDAIEKQITDMRHKFDNSKVKIRLICSLIATAGLTHLSGGRELG